MMRFKNVLALQSAPEVPTKAVARRAMAPRSRTEPLLEVVEEAKTGFTAAADSVRVRLQQDQAKALEGLQAEKTETLKEVEKQQTAHCEVVRSKGPEGKDRQRNFRDQKSGILQQTAVVSTEALFFQLHDVNQVESLQEAIRNEVRYRPDAIPLWVRVVSRKNEHYGTNNWSSTLNNTPANFYDLLMGTAADNFQSDHFPLTQVFAQGQDGCFVFTQNATNSYEDSNASGDRPYAAVAAVTLCNTTDEAKTCPVDFSLSCSNYAGLFVKFDTWTTLYQTTTSGTTHHQTAELTISAGQTAILMGVATPPYYQYSYSRRDTKYTSPFIRQFLHLGFFNLREIMACLSN